MLILITIEYLIKITIIGLFVDVDTSISNDESFDVDRDISDYITKSKHKRFKEELLNNKYYPIWLDAWNMMDNTMSMSMSMSY